MSLRRREVCWECLLKNVREQARHVPALSVLRSIRDTAPASKARKCHDVPEVTMYPRVSQETGV